ncbi:MAG TPA: hypothetical protein VIV09_14415 [Pseudolabrys sp.]
MAAIKTFAKLRTMSEVFDAGKVVEVKLVLEAPGVGEIYLRVPPGQYAIDDEFAVCIQPVDWK